MYNDINFNLSFGEYINTVEIDEFNMVTVFNNLIDNSIKYCNRKPILINITTTVQNDRLLIAYSDNGGGFTEILTDNIFKKFYRAETGKGNSKGLGIGLYLVKKIVEGHNGTITLSTTVENTIFNIKLPLK